MSDINDRAFLAYVPGVYPGKMTICKPRRKYAFLRDPFNGWGEIAAGGLEIIDLPVIRAASSPNRLYKHLRKGFERTWIRHSRGQTEAVESEFVLK